MPGQRCKSKWSFQVFAVVLRLQFLLRMAFCFLLLPALVDGSFFPSGPTAFPEGEVDLGPPPRFLKAKGGIPAGSLAMYLLLFVPAGVLVFVPAGTKSKRNGASGARLRCWGGFLLRMAFCFLLLPALVEGDLGDDALEVDLGPPRFLKAKGGIPAGSLAMYLLLFVPAGVLLFCCRIYFLTREGSLLHATKARGFVRSQDEMGVMKKVCDCQTCVFYYCGCMGKKTVVAPHAGDEQGDHEGENQNHLNAEDYYYENEEAYHAAQKAEGGGGKKMRSGSSGTTTSTISEKTSEKRSSGSVGSFSVMSSTTTLHVGGAGGGPPRGAGGGPGRAASKGRSLRPWREMPPVGGSLAERTPSRESAASLASGRGGNQLKNYQPPALGGGTTLGAARNSNRMGAGGGGATGARGIAEIMADSEQIMKRSPRFPGRAG